MTSREQFEVWCNSDPDRSITMEDSTRFFYAWEAWQASREAIFCISDKENAGWTSNDSANAALVMLDRIDTLESVDDDRIDGIKRIIRKLAVEIDRSGIKVKGE